VISRLEAEANAMWSFVHKQAKKPWCWIAMDATGGSRVCIAVHKGVVFQKWRWIEIDVKLGLC